MEPTVASIADVKHLAEPWDTIAGEAGRAPGADGLRFQSVGRGERFALLRVVGNRITAGTYRPAAPRLKAIPKAGGGFRTLSIRSVIDRVVARSLLEAVTRTYENWRRRRVTGTGIGSRVGWPAQCRRRT